VPGKKAVSKAAQKRRKKPNPGHPGPTVDGLLQESLTAHKAAQQVVKGGKLIRLLDYERLAVAYALRKQALLMDPERTDPAWQVEQVKTPNGRDTHLDLMTYYREKLGV